MDQDRFTVESTRSTEGTLWRAERTGPDGRMVDATLWTPNPRQAIRDRDALKADQYWTEPPWNRRGYVTAA